MYSKLVDKNLKVTIFYYILISSGKISFGWTLSDCESLYNV